MSRTVRVGAAAAAMLLLGTACAGNRTDSAQPPATGGGESSSAQASAEKFGTLDSPCGSGDAKGATDKGVTDTSISIGYGDDRGWSVSPGLNKEMGDAVGAMIDWCNSQGGINGRTIKGNQYDAAYSQTPQVMQKACGADFMLVGQGFATDAAGEQARVACQLPTVAGFTVSPNASMGPMHFEPVPYPVDFYNAAPLNLAAELFPGFKNSMTTVNSTSPPIQAGTAKVRGALQSMGIEPKDCGVTLSQQGDPSSVPFAEKFKQCGVEALWNSASPSPAQFNLLEANKRVGIDPTLVYEATWYNDGVAKWSAGSGQTLHSGLVFQPFENAGSVPAVKKYLEVVDGKGGKTALLGMQATSAFLLWATVAKDCGSELTRQCMVDGLSKVNEWTGGGLHAPSDPGNNKPTDCALMTELKAGKYSQLAPEQAGEFRCDPKYVVETDKSTWNTELNDKRVATAFLTPDVLTPQG